jgi:hypothetical protein
MYIYIYIRVGIFFTAIELFLLEDYHLFVERRFVRPNDPESYADWSISW